VQSKYEAGRGSTWTSRSPLTLSISPATLARVGPTTFAFPLNFIEAGVVLEGPTSRGEQGREWFQVVEAALPVVRLCQLFQLPGGSPRGVAVGGPHSVGAGLTPRGEDATKGLIVSVGDRREILVVDEVLMRQEIAIKQLDAILMQHPLLNGATLDPEGRVIPILNLPMLLKCAEQPRPAPARAPVRPEATKSEGKLRVLIVDDSLSVRKVQERFLTELGCQVVCASDGVYALEKLREQEFDFIFTDLEMPRLNGYELISELQGNPAWASVPVVVISSRRAEKYITKAMNLGATAFLTKPFTQVQLQEVLGRCSKCPPRGVSPAPTV
jgi:chemosensory pili system protein ChpA (sensor histidine kinase/response regulator)